MPFFIKTEIIKKEGITIKSGFLVDELNRPGDGGLLILEMNNYRNCLLYTSDAADD